MTFAYIRSSSGFLQPESHQVEQDVILSRLMVEIAGNELLGGELATRLRGA